MGRKKVEEWRDIPLNYERPLYTKCKEEDCNGEIIMDAMVTHLMAKWDEKQGMWIVYDGEYDDDPPTYRCNECWMEYNEEELLEKYQEERNKEVKWEKSNCSPKKTWKN